MNIMETQSKKIESSISEAIIKFEKEYLGRGPKEAKTFILDDMVIVRLKGVLTPAEEQLAKSIDGADLIKKVRMNLLENSRPLLEAIISDITGRSVISLHTDISTKLGERIIVFVVDKNL